MSSVAARTRRKLRNNNGSGSEADRIALVDQLWKLKKHWQEHTGSHVPLNVLIKEVDYRRDVLEGAERSGKPELEDLVRRIRGIEERLGEISSITAQVPARSTKLLWSGIAVSFAAIIALTLFLVLGGGLPGKRSFMLPVDAPDVAFRLHGSNTIGEELAPALLQAWYGSRNALEMLLLTGGAPVEKQLQFVLPDAPDDARAVEIHAHGSSTAFRDLASGEADLGMSSRRIKSSEVEQLAPLYGALDAPGSEHVVALDGLAVIVNPANPLNALGIAEIAAIFAGKVANWSELGGPNLPVVLYARDDNSGTFDTFKSLVLDANGMTLAGTAQRFESSSELSDSVAADRGAIGFIGLPYVRNAKALGIAESAEALPIVPTEFTVSTEDYPLSRRLYLYMPGNTANADIRQFVEFSLSDAGQQTVEKVGLVSQRVRTEPVRPRSDAPARFQELTRNAERLSVTLRFDPGGSRLDNKSVRDLERVIDFMKQHRDRRLLLLGFSGTSGTPDDDLALSEAQARVVEQMFAARGVYAAIAEGFGAALPVASNATVFGRRKNHRVEIWLQ